MDTAMPANPINAAIRPITFATNAESALGDLLTHLQGNTSPDIDYADLLSRLHDVVSRTADVVGEVCDRIEPLEGKGWRDARQKTVDALQYLSAAFTKLEMAVDSAEDA